MLTPIFTQLQNLLYESIFNSLRGLISQQSSSYSPISGNPSDFDELIDSAAQRYDLDPNLVKAVVKAESNFSPNAVSSAGAKGLMQLMDGTAQGLGVSDSFDPVQNIDGGARYLRQLLDKFDGDEKLALAAYNAGPGAVNRWGGIPPYQETMTYVSRVMNLANNYRQWEA
jgi:soluble lytic murein transglycosylase-like protein